VTSGPQLAKCDTYACKNIIIKTEWFLMVIYILYNNRKNSCLDNSDKVLTP